MKVFAGKGVNGGVAIGRLSIYQRNPKEIKSQHIEDVNSEIRRFEEAKEKTIEHLQRLYKKAVLEVGEADAMIFEVHQMMLQDVQYAESVTGMIESQKINAELAVEQTAKNLSEIFASMDDDYMRERAADVKDISKKLISVLSGENSEITLTEPAIIFADDLMPSETIQLDREMVLGFITQKGSMNSHTAILARTMDLPAIVGAEMELNREYDGVGAVIDGFEGKIYVDPDQETLKLMKEKQRQDIERKDLLKQLKGKESITMDGQKVAIYANIGSPEDVVKVIGNDAEGIGLFRSEFLYLEKNQYPTENEQFEAYKTVAEKMTGKKVIIRTLDIGADKQIDYFDLEKEENPAMGYRAIRICLDRADLFKTQLRAIYRASVYGTIAIMFPMIISLEEVLEIKEIIAEVKRELKDEGIAYADAELGIMIETPAAVMVSDLLAKEVDFFSIGTNDLTQYTLAIDRQNRKLDKIYNPYHMAVLRMIGTVAKNAHENGIWVGICGELAADLSMTENFLSMGIDELSVSPSKVLELRKKVREINRKDINE
jgi:phosphotransferase system enzyme I (PtsI)